MIQIREGRSEQLDAAWRKGDTITVYCGVSGIHSKGAESTDRVLLLLEQLGYYTVDLKMKTRTAITADWYRFKDGKQLAEALIDIRTELVLRHPDMHIRIVLIAHSYGCLKSSIAMDYLEEKGHPAPLLAVLVRPAMAEDWSFPKQENGKTKTIIVGVHSPDDKPIKWGSRMRFGHAFGKAGLVGFDEGIRALSVAKGHSGDFTSPHIHRLTEATVAASFEGMFDLKN